MIVFDRGFAVVHEAGALIDLRVETYTLEDRQIEALPRWLEARLLPVVSE